MSELPVVGALPAAVVRTQVVGDAFALTIDQLAYGKVAFTNPSVSGNA